MKCTSCGNEIKEGSVICNTCGNHVGNRSNFRGIEPIGTPYAAGAAIPQVVDQATAIDRAEFIRKTYTHMAMSILAFIFIEYLLLNWSGALDLVRMMVGGKNWLIVLIAFMGVSYMADKWARSSTSKQTQYLGLGLYIIAEAIIFLPILFIAKFEIGESVIGSAGFVTLGLFAGLTYIVFSSRKDFSFMGSILGIGSFVALGVIVASMLFGFNLGLLFSAIMVAFASGAILYSTSNIIHHYRTDQYVAAALSLFSSIMLLFWYILRIFMGSRD